MAKWARRKKGSKYVTRSKVMDTTSLAGVDPAINGESETGRKSHHRGRFLDFDGRFAPSHGPNALPIWVPIPQHAFGTWPASHTTRDLRGLGGLEGGVNRCLEMVDVEEPEDVLPVLRGIIHECSWFLHEFEEPSVIFMAPRQVTTPISPPAASPNLTSTCLAIRHHQLLPSALSLTRDQDRLRHPVAVPIHAIDIITSANHHEIIATAQAPSTSLLPSIVSLYRALPFRQYHRGKPRIGYGR
ncbi:hypothetical protein FA13DRAFT_758239 [Coprinellus micaceus]|uniref:Uncharacterized protein n=1 Tax=Coprinellus micaceus TaxID=71717 RepID=A0A4Y7T3U5_COPMI|nr:hypothetical protein FA13DRAFT_758239 [Coprinellus micaceus]